jgi:phosphatidylinositol 4-kinase
VIPDATSRDEMGRAKINDLTSFFIGKFGPVDSIGFQTARMNFIRSMAAYSVMCYLIQIKDRHNGNIMIDGQGHITHIDFGFLFDIGPGGIKFEPNSFKLTGEMIALMGGQNSAGFRAFQELVIKGFLISRPFFKEIVTCVKLMSDTQLPSFKGESTITKFIERFKPNLSDREAAVFMQSVISNAKQNGLSLLYDECVVYRFLSM